MRTLEKVPCSLVPWLPCSLAPLFPCSLVPCFLRLVAVGGSGFVGVALQGELDEPRDQVPVTHSGCLPQLGVHADAGEAGQRVHLVDVYAALAVWLHEEIDAGQAR